MMRPHWIGWVLVGLFGIGGVVLWQLVPAIMVGQIWVGVAAVLALVYVLITRAGNRASRLAATGIRGTAQVLHLAQTGVRVNNQPRVRLRLRVEAPGIAPFETDKTVTVPLVALGMLQPGRPLAVALDPARPDRFVIDWFGNPNTPPVTLSTQDNRTADLAGDPATTQAVLEVLRKYGLPAGGGVDLRGNPQARAEVLAILERSGHLQPPAVQDTGESDPA